MTEWDRVTEHRIIKITNNQGPITKKTSITNNQWTKSKKISSTKHQIPNKFQIPSTKLQINSKFQAPNDKSLFRSLEFWSLRFIWDLGFEIWNFLFWLLIIGYCLVIVTCILVICINDLSFFLLTRLRLTSTKLYSNINTRP